MLKFRGNKSCLNFLCRLRHKRRAAQNHRTINKALTMVSDLVKHKFNTFAIFIIATAIYYVGMSNEKKALRLSPNSTLSLGPCFYYPWNAFTFPIQHTLSLGWAYKYLFWTCIGKRILPAFAQIKGKVRDRLQIDSAVNHGGNLVAQVLRNHGVK